MTRDYDTNQYLGSSIISVGVPDIQNVNHRRLRENRLHAKQTFCLLLFQAFSKTNKSEHIHFNIHVYAAMGTESTPWPELEKEVRLIPYLVADIKPSNKTVVAETFLVSTTSPLWIRET